MSFELRKFVAPEFVFGPGARVFAGRYARNFGAKKVLLVTDPGVAGAGWAGEARECVEAEGLACAVFERVTSNPKDNEVMAGAEVFRAERCDAIVAVGGGSPMDCAKGIGIVSSNMRHVLEFEGVDRVAVPAPPLICIPTTAGTSADVSQFAIITDTGRKVKIAIISKTVVPDVALIDPETTVTMDAGLTACTGMDALVHAFESYVSNASSPITDLHALEAARLVSSNIRQAVASPQDAEARYNMMLGSLHAGLAFSNASLGAVHAIAHSLGGLLDLPHGEANAIILPYVIDYNFPEAALKYRALACAMGLDLSGMTDDGARDALTDAIRRLLTDLGVERRIGEMGATREDIPRLAMNALNDPCMITNPRRPARRDIEELLEKAY